MLYTVGSPPPQDPSQSPIPRTGGPPQSTRCAMPWPRCPSFRCQTRRSWSPTPQRRSPRCRTTPACRLAASSRSATSAAPAPASRSSTPQRLCAHRHDVRHSDLSGDLVDQALLTHVINDLSAAGTIDLSGTLAIGSLTRLRAQCRGAKERLSTAAVTSLVAELPGHSSEVRLTRNEARRGDPLRPLGRLAGVVQETVERNGIRTARSRCRGLP